MDVAEANLLITADQPPREGTPEHTALKRHLFNVAHTFVDTLGKKGYTYPAGVMVAIAMIEILRNSVGSDEARAGFTEDIVRNMEGYMQRWREVASMDDDEAKLHHVVKTLEEEIGTLNAQLNECRDGGRR